MEFIRIISITVFMVMLIAETPAKGNPVEPYSEFNPVFVSDETTGVTKDQEKLKPTKAELKQCLNRNMRRAATVWRGRPEERWILKQIRKEVKETCKTNPKFFRPFDEKVNERLIPPGSGLMAPLR